MPGYDGNGNFVRTYNWVNDRNNNIDITASRVDTEDNGFATGLSNVMCKDGQSTPTADLKMATFKFLNVGDAVLGNQFASLNQLQGSASLWGGTAGGTVDAITFNLTPAITAYTNQIYRFLSSGANTSTTPTVNINGVGAKTIVKLGSQAVAAGDIPAGAYVILGYDGTNMQLLGVGYPPGKETVSVPAAAMIPTVTNGSTSLITVEISALQPNLRSLDFDPSTVQYAEFSVTMPKSYNGGTMTAIFLWAHPATTTNFGVTWGIQAVAVPTNSAIGVAYGSAQTTVSTGGTTNNLYISSETSAFTPGGTAAGGNLMYFKVARVATDAGDTLAVNAKLVGVRILYTATSLNDS